MKVVFMGTPDFAVPSLEALAKEGFDILGLLLSLIALRVGDKITAFSSKGKGCRIRLKCLST